MTIKLFLDLLPWLLLAVRETCIYYFWLLTDQLLTCDKATDKDDQQSSETSCIDTDYQEVANRACSDDELPYPVECSGDCDSVETLDTTTESWSPLTELVRADDESQCLVDYCSETDKPQEMVIAVPEISENLKMCLQGLSPPTEQEIYEDDCDDSESEDEDNSSAAILGDTDDYLNYCDEEERFVFCGAVLDQLSDTKSDHGEESEALVADKENHTMIQQQSNNDNLVPPDGSAGNDNQERLMGLQATSTKLTNKQTATTYDQVKQQDHNHVKMFPDYNTPND